MTEVKKVSCLVINDDKVLLIKSSKDKCWYLPTKLLDETRDEQDLAIEAVKESSGLNARIIQVFGIHEYQMNGRNFVEKVFEGDLPSTQEIPDEKKEFTRWCSVEEAQKHICEELVPVLDYF